ncbi:MAG: hypothetical protein JWQ11_1632 [Rhizobacter sp.]|nr:hypothetical protein [Rhizobacter sp.]
MSIATPHAARTTFSFELGPDGVAVVAIDIAGRPMNVFTPELIAELGALVDEVASNDEIAGLVITSGKPGAFLAGADLKDFVNIHDRGVTPKQAMESAALATGMLRRLERCGKPVAAAINGLALGGGYELCLACHHRVLVDEPKASVGLPEVTVGLLPGGGGTQRLPRLIGVAAALPLLVSGRHVKPAEALSLGMVDEVVPTGQAVQAARRWVVAQREAKWTAAQPWDVKGFELPGGTGAMAAHASATFGNGLASMRRDTHDNYPAPLAILQCVYEGSQLPFDKAMAVEARYFAVLLTGVVARNLMRTMFVGKGSAAKRHRPAGVDKIVVKRLGVVGASAQAQAFGSTARAAGIGVTALASGESVGRNDFDLVVTVGPDVVAQEADGQSSGDTKGEDAAGGVGIDVPPLGAHGPMIEIIVTAATSPVLTAAALDLAAQLRHTPIVVNGGSMVRRLREAYRLEGVAMLDEGVGRAMIENVARQTGFAQAPLAAEAADGANRQAGLTQPAPSDIRQRLLFSQALEAARCFEEGLVTDPTDGDLAGVLGAGYPSWTGGPLTVIDTTGPRAFVEACDRLTATHGERFRPSVALRRRALDNQSFHPPVAR